MSAASGRNQGAKAIPHKRRTFCRGRRRFPADRKDSALTTGANRIQYPIHPLFGQWPAILFWSQEAFMHLRGAGSLPWLRSALVRAALLFTLCLPGLLWAQVSITGKITGVVTDSSGAVVPNATVEVTGPALMAPRSAHTQSDG